MQGNANAGFAKESFLEASLSLPISPMLSRKYEQYKSIVATAGQVDIFKDKYEKRKKAQDKRDKELDERCTELKNGWQELEKKRRMPMKEQQELAILHKLKESVLWLIEQPFVPETVRKLLIRALGGENLSQMLGRTQKQLENRRQIER